MDGCIRRVLYLRRYCTCFIANLLHYNIQVMLLQGTCGDWFCLGVLSPSPLPSYSLIDLWYGIHLIVLGIFSIYKRCCMEYNHREVMWHRSKELYSVEGQSPVEGHPELQLCLQSRFINAPRFSRIKSTKYWWI